MINLIKKLSAKAEAETTLTLPLSKRNKSRLRVTLDDGRDAGLFLERGLVLKNGDLLASDTGIIVEIISEKERVSIVRCDDTLQIAQACYHLGNRHVALQIDPGRIQYLHDHVLDEMLAGLGLDVHVEMAPFEPEPGAYGSHSTSSHSHQQ